MHAGRSLDVSRWKIGRIALGTQRDGIVKPLLSRFSSVYRSARFFWSKTSKSTVPWSRIPTIGSASPWFTPFCCGDGSLASHSAAVAPGNFPGSIDVRRGGVNSHQRAPNEQCQHQSGESSAAQPTLLNQQPHIAALMLILPVTKMRPSELLALREKDPVPPLVPPLPCWSVIHDRSIRNWSVCQGKDPRWVGPHGLALAAAAKMSKTATGSLEVNGMTICQTRHNGQASIWCAVSELCKKFKKRGQWRAFSSVARYDRSSRLEADCHSLLLPLRSFSSQVDDWIVYARRVRWTWLPDKSDESSGFALLCTVTNFGPRYDVPKPIVLTRIRQDVSAGKCVAGMIFTSTTAHFVLSQ